MNTIVFFALVAVAITGLALIHETRLRRAAHSMTCRLVEFLGDNNTEAPDQARDGQ